MSRHTPGPWSVSSGLMFGAKVDGTFNPIGFVYGPSFAERSAVGVTSQANARLISAAPDLLAALQERFRKTCGHQFDCVCADDMAVAAIAKATQP